MLQNSGGQMFKNCLLSLDYKQTNGYEVEDNCLYSNPKKNKRHYAIWAPIE